MSDFALVIHSETIIFLDHALAWSLFLGLLPSCQVHLLYHISSDTYIHYAVSE